MYKNLFDCHVHSDNSHDGKDAIELLCKAGVEKNLKGISITDHYELNLDTAMADRCLKKSFEEAKRAGESFNGRISVLKGIEMGQAIQNIPKAESVLKQYEFDVVIGSLHCDRRMSDYAYVDFLNLDAGLILQHYFEEMLELCRWGGFDTLAHLTYPLRYIAGTYGISVDMKRYEELIREILCTLAEKNLALEINTAGLRKEIGRTAPTLNYVKLFKELGGELLTFGSDAHNANDLGAGLDTAFKMAEEAGFRYFAVYKNRKACMLPLC